MTAEGQRSRAEDRLRDLQVITDAALSHLDEGDLLTELLDRAKDIMQADTAAVLLVNRASGELLATAASGLEDEVRQGVSVPLGRGFAGRIAAERKPMILDRVDASTVLNPLLRAKGVKSLLGVPLVAAGEVLGVLHVGSRTAHRFTREDAELLQVAADRAATAVHSQLARSDRAAALALQRSLSPPMLPDIPGAEISGRYVPGNGVAGGDWYDVFRLPSGELGIVIGDVAGSGLPAAVAMGRLRSVLRAYALEATNPAWVLDRLDRKIQHFEPGALATVLYAVLSPGLDSARICSAGHPPPVIAHPRQPAALASVEPGLMIGVALDTRRQVTTVKIPPGAVLCFYTDGLIERRGRPLDDGLALLCQAVTAEPPAAACASVMAAMVGHQAARDDIALLIVQRAPLAASDKRPWQAPLAGTSQWPNGARPGGRFGGNIGSAP